MTLRRLATVFVATVCLASCDGGTVPDPEIPAENATEAPMLPTLADALPTMDPDGFEELMGQLEGTPVLVNFWGSWCPPCEDEIPRIVAAHREWGDRVQFVGVDIQDSLGPARRFMERFEMSYPSVFDPPDAIKTSQGHLGQPVTAFYRADGSIEFSWTGPIQADVLEEHLRAIAG